MVKKSDIVKKIFILIERTLIFENERNNNPDYSINDIIYELENIPKHGFPWKNLYHNKRYKKKSKSAKSSTIVEILIIDASQSMMSLVHKGNFGPNGFPVRYSGMAKNFNGKIIREVMGCKNLRTTIKGDNIDICSKVFVGFDNSSESTPAKFPEQRKRRFDRLKRLREKIELSESLIDDILINDEYVPENWNNLRLWPRYGSTLSDYLTESVHKSDPDIYSEFRNKCNTNASSSSSSSNQTQEESNSKLKLYTWRKGLLKIHKSTKSSSGREEFNENEFSNIGEVDHLTERIIMDQVDKFYENYIKSKKIDDTDFSSIIIRINTVDTDLLLYALWTLEHIDMKYDLDSDNSLLPVIYIVSPPTAYRKYRVLDVTLMYSLLKLYLFVDYSESCESHIKEIVRPPVFKYSQKDEITLSDKKKEYTSIRNFCTAMFSWGNDYMPNVYGISADNAMDAYVMMGRTMDNLPLIEIDEKTKSVIVSMKAVKLFYYLMFYMRYEFVKTRCSKKCQNNFDHNDDDEKPPCMMEKTEKIKKVNVNIIKRNSIKNVENVVKVKSDRRKNKWERCGNDSRILSRYMCTQMTCFFLDHSLGLTIGSKSGISIKDLTLRPNMYINCSREIIENANVNVKLLKKIGIFDEKRMIDYSPSLYTKSGIVRTTKKKKDKEMKDDCFYREKEPLLIDVGKMQNANSLEEAISLAFDFP